MFNTRLDTPLLNHLKDVYSLIASGSLLASLAAIVHCTGIVQNEILAGLGFISFIISFAIIASTKRDEKGENDGTRLAAYRVFAFCCGLSIAPAIKIALDLEPSIVILALFYTSVIFACFSLSATLGPERKYLWLLAPLMSIFMVLWTASLINYYLQSYTFTYIQLIIGPLLQSGFILYETQAIIERFRQGDKDYIWHAVLLFMELITLLRDILYLLIAKEKKKKGNGDD